MSISASDAISFVEAGAEEGVTKNFESHPALIDDVRCGLKVIAGGRIFGADEAICQLQQSRR